MLRSLLFDVAYESISLQQGERGQWCNPAPAFDEIRNHGVIILPEIRSCTVATDAFQFERIWPQSLERKESLGLSKSNTL